MNWRTGCWTAEDQPAADHAGLSTMTIASDWMPLRAFEEPIRQDPTAVYGDLLPLLRQSDLNAVNVECPIGICGAPIPKAGPNFRAEESSVRSLADAPFHIACLANNHIMDYGPDSLRRTLDVLAGAGLRTIGAGMTGEEAAKPIAVEVGGTRVAILNCAEGEACRSYNNGPGAHGYERAAIEEQIRQLKQEADVVLVIFHGGREYVPVPPEYVVESLRGMAEAGASAVIAHHPHVPQGIEIYKGAPIFYSQGNFVFWQENECFYPHHGYLVHLKLGAGRLTGFEITPYSIKRSGLSVMRGEARTAFFNILQEVSAILDRPEDRQEVWQAFVDSVGLKGMAGAMERALNLLPDKPETGAAMLLNLFVTPAHREMFECGLRRAAVGQLGDSAEWAKKLVRHWTRCSISEWKDALKEVVSKP